MQGMAALLLACLLIASPVFAAEPSGARMKELVVSKTPYSTTIQAVVDGAIGNYNSFKTSDPFRIVVDIWEWPRGRSLPRYRSTRRRSRGEGFLPGRQDPHGGRDAG
jgi:hypothetical protein